MGTSGTSAAAIIERLSSKPLVAGGAAGNVEVGDPRHYVPPPNEAWRREFLGLDESHHPLVRTLGIMVERFTRSCLRNNRSKGHWLTICGQTGAGKTHVAQCVATYVGHGQIQAMGIWIHKDYLPSPAFIQWPIEVRRNDREWDVLMSEMVGCHLVVVDDIGAEIDKFKSGEAVVRLWEVLETSRDRWLFLTTNVRPLKWRETFGQRCSDRMLEGGVVDVSDVPSYRTRA